MTTATKARLTPRTARTNREICSLDRTALDLAGFWLLVEETEVHLHAQRSGEPPTASITIPKRQFDKLVDFYNGAAKRVSGNAARARP